MTKESFKALMENKFESVNYSAFLSNTKPQKVGCGWTGSYPIAIDWQVSSAQGSIVNWFDENINTDDQVTTLFTAMKDRAALPDFVPAPILELILQENVDIHSIEVS